MALPTPVNGQITDAVPAATVAKPADVGTITSRPPAAFEGDDKAAFVAQLAAALQSVVKK